MPKKPSKSKVDAAIEQLDSVRSAWLRRPNVTAVDVGFKIKDREITDQIAVRVHVERKLPMDGLEPYEVISESGSPSKVGDFPIDVIEAVYAPAALPALALEPEAVDRKSAVDPLVGGVSVGNPRVTAGTLGAVVWDRRDCKVCMLSNWHVLVGSKMASAGEPIYQPGVFDGGTAADTVAHLKRWRLDQDMDAGLAELDGSRGFTRDLLELGPIAGIATPTLGMQVVKSGRTTGVTEGMVDGVSTSLSIDYGGGTVQTFHDQIHIVPRPPWPTVDYEVSKGGDSGSVWIEESTSKAIGLHFAGETDPSPTAENAIANRIAKVAEELELSFTPLFCALPPFDDRLRARLHELICRRFPFLCHPIAVDPRFRFPFPDPGPFDPRGPLGGGGPIGPIGPVGSSPGGQAAGGGATVDQSAEVDALIAEILAEIRRSRSA